MNKIILSCLFFLFVSGAQAVESKCEMCVKIDQLILDVDNEDHIKAYNEFYALAGVDQLSKDKKVREQEVASLVKGIVKFMSHDVSKELPAYALDIKKKNPKEFKAALEKISKEERADLEKYMKITEDIMNKGENEAEADYYKREAKFISQPKAVVKEEPLKKAEEDSKKKEEKPGQ